MINNGQFNESSFQIIVFFLNELQAIRELLAEVQRPGSSSSTLGQAGIAYQMTATWSRYCSAATSASCFCAGNSLPSSSNRPSQPGVWGNGVLSQTKQSAGDAALWLQPVWAPAFPRNMHEEVQSPGRSISFCLSQMVLCWKADFCLPSSLSPRFRCSGLLLHSQGWNCRAGKGKKKCNKMLRNPPGMLLGALQIVMQSSLDSPEDWDFYYFFFNEENWIQISSKTPLFGFRTAFIS